MEEYLVPILRKMCDCVNADYDSVDFKEPDWYTHHRWTQDEEQDFKKWLAAYLKKNKEARNLIMHFPSTRKDALEKVADQFIFQFGWSYK